MAQAIFPQPGSTTPPVQLQHTVNSTGNVTTNNGAGVMGYALVFGGGAAGGAGTSASINVGIGGQGGAGAIGVFSQFITNT